MRLLRCSAAGLLALAVVPSFWAGDAKDDGFVPMFNGKDLTGWVNVNCAPGTFFVKDGEVITTGKPTGYLRTTRQYENFIADFEWMHVPPKPGAVGNSGFFVWADPIPAVGTGYTRGIEVQVLVNLEYRDKKTNAVTATSHGDLFSIWGATCVPERPHPLGWARCLPSEDRAKGANEWNHYRVEANDGVIKLAVNGKVVSSVSKCAPRKGYLALESEGSECHFRNLKIKELPSTNPKPEDVADEDKGFKSLFTGLDLSGWKVDEGTKNDWQPDDGKLRYAGKGVPKGKSLNTEKFFADAEFIVDFRFPSKKDVEQAPCLFILRDANDRHPGVRLRLSPDGTYVLSGAENEVSKGSFQDLKPAGQWNRLTASKKRGLSEVKVNGKPLDKLSSRASGEAAFGLRPGGEIEFINLFVRTLKE